MKKLFAAIVLFVPLVVLAGEFDPSKTTVTGLIYGPAVNGGVAIVDSKVVRAGSVYDVTSGTIAGLVSGTKAISQVGSNHCLHIASVNSRGVTMIYRGKTYVKGLKRR